MPRGNPNFLLQQSLRQGRIATTTEVAEWYAVTQQTVRGWMESGCPYIERGSKGKAATLNTKDVHDWLIGHELRKKGIGGPEGDDRTSLTHRKALADTESREIDLERKAGQLVPIGWFVEANEIINDNVNAKLSAVANRCAPLVAIEDDPKKCHQIIERAINDAKRELVAPTEQSLISAAISGTGLRGSMPELQTVAGTDDQ